MTLLPRTCVWCGHRSRSVMRDDLAWPERRWKCDWEHVAECYARERVFARAAPPAALPAPSRLRGKENKHG